MSCCSIVCRVIFLATLLHLAFSYHHKNNRSKDAYVILQYGDYHLGARVLGRTLDDTGTTKDRVAMCLDSVSEQTKEILRADGWIIKPVGHIPNPNVEKSKKGTYFSGAYGKFHAWNMTEYERVVYLDSDILVVANIDHLFDCGTFCVSYRHSDHINSGVMVVEPSTAVFNDMISQVLTIPSYDHGDQGFIDFYFKDLIYAPYFNWSDSRRQHQPMRMPAGLNANIGIYYSNSEWKFKEGELKVIHFTMGPIKPWVWWAHRLFDINWKWTNIRRKLPSYGHAPGVLSQPVLWAPYPLFVLLFLLIRTFNRTLNSKNVVMRTLKSFNSRYSHFIPLQAALLSYYLAFFYIVPTTMLPRQAEYVFWLWSSLFLWLFMGTYCCLCHVASKRQDLPSQNISRKLLQTTALFAAFTTSHIIQTLVPEAVTRFSHRVTVFLILTVVHAVVIQVTGQAVIRVWTNSNNHSSTSKKY